MTNTNAISAAAEARRFEHPCIAEIAILDSVAFVTANPEALRNCGTGHHSDLLRTFVMAASEGLLSAMLASNSKLPRGQDGRIDKDRLTARIGAPRDTWFPEKNPDGEEILGMAPASRAAWDLLARRFSPLRLSLAMSPALDLGIDSIAWMDIIAELALETGQRLPEDAVPRIATLRDLLDEMTRAPKDSAPPPAAMVFAAPEAALSPAEAAYLKPSPVFLRPLERVIHTLNRMAVRLWFGLDVEGLENLPAKGGYVIAANHVSDLDHFAITAAFPYRLMRQVHWAGDKQRLFSSPLKRFLCRLFRVHPAADFVARETVSRGCLVLKRGGIHVWFPEGWRAPDGRLQNFARGLPAVLHHTGAPVIPVIVEGTFEAMPRTRKFPLRKRLRVRFGNKLESSELERIGHGKDPYSRIASALAAEMRRMTGEGDPEKEKPLPGNSLLHRCESKAPL